LKQPRGETLLTFLCSSNKQIVQIQQITGLLAERFGEPLFPGAPVNTLPGWDRLAELDVDSLLQCRMGYRAGHVKGTALFLRDHPDFLPSIEALSTEDGKAALQELPGVGPKVAECLLLFGFGRLDAFPIDTWVLKILEAHYGLVGWRRRQLEHFARVHFGIYAGLAQQYLFAQARLDGLRRKDGGG
jgi:N-glycosylase/DNA lyase